MRKYSVEEKTGHIEKWKASGQSRIVYARENGLAQQTLCKWINDAEKMSTGFVELPTGKASESQQAKPNPRQRLEIRKKELRFSIPLDIEKENLKNLLEVLAAL